MKSYILSFLLEGSEGSEHEGILVEAQYSLLLLWMVGTQVQSEESQNRQSPGQST